MPLDPSGLESDIEAITDPVSQAAAAQDWADAMESYASGVIPASTTVSAAAATLKGQFQSAFGSTDAATTSSTLEAGFAAFATTVAAGMLPAFTGTPPPAPVGFMPLLTVNQPSQSAAAALWASTIDTWMKTGMATLVVPPNTVVSWS